tara:strand:- start:274 stop:465 length:192 start_codon:yes stop_codon:yes gene_type:complete
MKNCYIIFFLILFSCGYPDIDSVPDFKDMKISEEEAIELCKINNSDNQVIDNCISEILKNEQK